MLRRALHDAAAHVPSPDIATDRVVRPGRPAPGWRRPLVGGLVALLAIAAIPIGAALLGSGDRHTDNKEVTHRIGGAHDVLQALAATVDSGSYDLDFTFHITPAHVALCTGVDSARGLVDCGEPLGAMDVRGHGTVNTSPYAMTVVTGAGALSGITLFVNDSTVWELGGAGYGTDAASPSPSLPGISLSGFAATVEGTLGSGQGAQTMLSIANNTGYLGLESEMIRGATSDGTGALADGTPITYYRVDVDLTRMADAGALSSEQRQAIDDAIVVLRAAGYSGTDERIGVDDAGFIREVVATTNFADGSAMTRHSFFSNFGCAKRVSMPNAAQVDGPAGTCPPIPATTTTAPSSTSTTAGSTTTTDAVPTTTTEEPTTAPVPVSTSPPSPSTAPTSG